MAVPTSYHDDHACGWQKVRRSGKAAVRALEVKRNFAKMVWRILGSDGEIAVEEDLSGRWARFFRQCRGRKRTGLDWGKWQSLSLVLTG